MNGIKAIAAERRRQIEAEGWTPEHDDKHRDGELARAAGCYAFVAAGLHSCPTMAWPWSAHWWKPKDRRSNLVRAGALIAAEIDRLDRMAAPDAAREPSEPAPPVRERDHGASPEVEP